MEQVIKFSPILFALIIFCFLLPFFNLSFEGQKVASITGLQLLTKDDYHASDDLRYNHLGHLTEEQQRIRAAGGAYGEGTEVFPYGNIYPILALLMASLGLVISYMKMNNLIHGNKSFLIMLFSISGSVILFLLKNNLDEEILSFEKGRFFIEYEFGYWFSLLLFVVSAVVLGIIFNYEWRKSKLKPLSPVSTLK